MTKLAKVTSTLSAQKVQHTRACASDIHGR